MNNKIDTAINARGFSNVGVWKGEASYVLYALGEYIFTDQTLTFFCFSLVQPGDTLVQKVAECFRFDRIADGCRHATCSERHRCLVA